MGVGFFSPTHLKKKKMTDQGWENAIQKYYGGRETTPLHAHINDPPLYVGSPQSFLEECLRTCKCANSVTNCLVLRCLQYNPSLQLMKHFKHAVTILDLAFAWGAALHIISLCKYGARLGYYSDSGLRYLVSRMLGVEGAYPPMLALDCLIKHYQIDWRSPALQVNTPVDLALLPARFEARESHCRRAAATILSARFRRATGLYKDLNEMIARSVWATRRKSKWQ